MRYQIRFVTGELFNQVFPLRMGNALSIGRSHTNIVKLSSAAEDVSARHISLRLEPSGASQKVVAEILSSRKTLCEGQKVSMGTILDLIAGQKITMGEYNSFVLESLPDTGDETKSANNSDEMATVIEPTPMINPKEIFEDDKFPDTPELQALHVAKPEPSAEANSFKSASLEIPRELMEASRTAEFTAAQAAEMTMATQAGDATTATQVSEMTMATQAGDATTATQAAEMTMATQAGDATTATQVSEMTMATQAGDATTATQASPSLSALGPGNDDSAEAEEENDEEDDANCTLAQETQIATEDELERIRQLQGKASRKKFWLYGMAGAVVFGLIMFLYYYHHTSIEETVLWPTESNGALAIATIPIDNNSYLIIYPPWSGARQVVKPDIVQVETRIGVLHDIPLCLTLEYGNDRKGLTADRDDVLLEWMENRKKQDSNWNFTSSVTTGFSHEKHDQGILYSVCSFSRMKDGIPWVGYVALSRNGERRYILIAEIPQWAQSRANDLLRRNVTDLFFFFRKISQIDLRWEGCAHYRDQSKLQDDLEEVRYLMKQHDVKYWSRIQFLLTSALIKSVQQNNANTLQQALTFLKRFRLDQRKFYSRQKMAYLMAESALDENAQKEVQTQCESAFTAEFRNSDCRYSLIRRKDWK